MLTSPELKRIPIFSCLDDANLMWLSQQVADLHLERGEYLIHEGELTPFFVVMNGTTEVLKDVMGRRTEVSEHKSGDFFGELAILMGSAAPASVRAKTVCHVARLDSQHLQELIRRSPECSAVILQTLNERVQVVQKYMLSLPSTRVQIAGSKFDDDCREIRTFLSMNRIPYEWVDRDRSSQPTSGNPACNVEGISVIVDDSFCVSHPPSVRKVAEALGFQTAPYQQTYDVVIIGGGPAGLAAAVYGASEGLSVLLVERKAPGGQAGTSSRIENYLGFPNGVSGDDLSQRAFRQAVKFGAEVVLTREVQKVIPRSTGGYAIGLDGEERVITRTVILATGVAWRRLEADGVDRFIGRGVLYGAARTEAPTVAGRQVFIIGGGNSAGQAALFFADYASSVTMLVRGEGLEHSMSQYLIDQIALAPGIRVETETQVVSAHGTDCLKAIETQKAGKPVIRRAADALFVMIGADAVTHWLPPQLRRENGYVRTGREVTDQPGWAADRPPFPLETNLPGFFCVGDVRYNSIKRVSSSVGEGSMAIAFVHQYLSLTA
ncbi:FAD-dependent oxidoreductase [Terriglobus albidus]|uniref:FAD-dependent oxidoreductase n=1 Tax=Terriglobus albidus TaxID=1592106 RepID=A0A5B9EAI6_9BACT|nr:cyclic nucleotide-binding domain-containing thioredoxin-disulfide reductase [Terriglobus albidus]QEE28789.1 FAD-dependent oxidoreductase [Terriglobus albidus]